MTIDGDARKKTALEAVRTANAALDPEQRATREHDAVHAAHRAGATVAKIADFIGQQAPHVTRKYGPFDRADRARTPDPTVVATALGELRILFTEGNEARAALTAAVAKAREAGATWQAIADVLERSQPNVVQQFAPLLDVKTETKVQVLTKRRKPVRLTAEQRAELARRVQAGEPIADLAAESGASAPYLRGLRRKP